MKTKNKPPTIIKLDCLNNSLSYLLAQVEGLGVKKADYPKIEIGLDFSSCYYEGDEPDVKAIVPAEIINV